MEPESLIDVSDHHQPIDASRAVGEHIHARGASKRGPQIANDARHQRLERHEPRRSAVFVDDERLTDPAPPHLREEIVGAQSLRHGQRFAGNGGQVDRATCIPDDRQQIGHVQNPDDVVQIAAVHR